MAMKSCKECGKSISTEAKTCPNCGKTNPTGGSLTIGQIGCLSILVLVILGQIFGGGSSSTDSTGSTSTSTASNPAPDPPDPKDAVANQLDLTFTWSKEGFDNIMKADFVITNKSDRAVKDLSVTCTHFASSGTEIDHNTRTIYEVVPAHGKKRIKGFSMGFIHSQVKKSGCTIDNFEFAD